MPSSAFAMRRVTLEGSSQSQALGARQCGSTCYGVMSKKPCYTLGWQMGYRKISRFMYLPKERQKS